MDSDESRPSTPTSRSGKASRNSSKKRKPHSGSIDEPKSKSDVPKNDTYSLMEMAKQMPAAIFRPYTLVTPSLHKASERLKKMLHEQVDGSESDVSTVSDRDRDSSLDSSGLSDSLSGKAESREDDVAHASNDVTVVKDHAVQIDKSLAGSSPDPSTTNLPIKSDANAELKAGDHLKQTVRRLLRQELLYDTAPKSEIDGRKRCNSPVSDAYRDEEFHISKSGSGLHNNRSGNLPNRVVQHLCGSLSPLTKNYSYLNRANLCVGDQHEHTQFIKPSKIPVSIRGLSKAKSPVFENRANPEVVEHNIDEGSPPKPECEIHSLVQDDATCGDVLETGKRSLTKPYQGLTLLAKPHQHTTSSASRVVVSSDEFRDLDAKISPQLVANLTKLSLKETNGDDKTNNRLPLDQYHQFDENLMTENYEETDPVEKLLDYYRTITIVNMIKAKGRNYKT